MLTILVKNIVNTINNTLKAKSIANTNTKLLLKSIANTNTNNSVTILFHIQQCSFFSAVIY